MSAARQWKVLRPILTSLDNLVERDRVFLACHDSGVEVIVSKRMYAFLTTIRPEA